MRGACVHDEADRMASSRPPSMHNLIRMSKVKVDFFFFFTHCMGKYTYSRPHDTHTIMIRRGNGKNPYPSLQPLLPSQVFELFLSTAHDPRLSTKLIGQWQINKKTARFVPSCLEMSIHVALYKWWKKSICCSWALIWSAELIYIRAYSLRFSSNWALNQVYIESNDEPNRSHFRMNTLATANYREIFISVQATCSLDLKNEAHQH